MKIIENKELFTEEVTEFLELLFGNIQVSGYGQIELKLIKNGTEKSTFHSKYVTLIDEAYEGCNNGWNVSFGVNPRIGGAGKKENIRYLTSFHAEVQYRNDGHNKQPGYLNDSEASDAINKYCLEPTILVHSEGGFHCYWVLHNAVEVETYGVQILESINKGIGCELKASVGSHDLSRVLPIPMTFSPFLIKEPLEIWVESLKGKKYFFEDFERFFKKIDSYQYQCNRVLNIIRNIFLHEDQCDVITLEEFYEVYWNNYCSDKNIFSEFEIKDIIISSIGYKVDKSTKYNNKLCIFNKKIW